MTHYYPRCVGARHPKCDRRPILSQVLVRRARQPRQHSPRAQANPARASWRARCDTRGLGDLIEAMAPAGGLLTLSAYVNEETEAHTVVVEIADSGPGIAPEQLERIWEAFYTTKTEGTGLGLSIVRALVAEQPGAQIGLRSTVGVGTVFSLTFPS